MVDTAVKVKAYSSIANLGYGFDAFGLCVDAASDVVTLERADRASAIDIEGQTGNGIPAEWERNTAGLAVRAVMAAHGLDEPLRMHIAKGIRPGSGLGSSAASAAAAVVAIDALFGLGLSQTELVTFAAEGERAAAGAAHADNVAAAICGGLTIVDQREPLRLTVVDAASEIRFVVATPGVELATEESRKVMPSSVTMKEYAAGCARCGAITAALIRGDAAALGAAVEGSFVDRARSPLIPGFDEVRRLAKQAGAFGVTISGAGPTVMAVVGDGAERVVDAMKAGFETAGLSSVVHVTSVGPAAQVVEEIA